MCLKGKKDKVEGKSGVFACEKCKALSDKKKDLCKPEKLKDKSKDKSKGKKKK